MIKEDRDIIGQLVTQIELLTSQQNTQLEQITSQQEAQLASKDELIRNQSAQIYSLTQKIETLTSNIAKLTNYRYGRSCERSIDPSIPTLFNEAELAAMETAGSDTKVNQQPEKEIEVKAHTKRRLGRQRIPDDIPRVTTIIDPENLPEGARKIGEEITETLEYDPAKFYVKRVIRNKYIYPEDGNIIIAPLPPQAISKGKAGESLLAYLIVSKFCDHLPLHRINKIFKRSSYSISDSTMCNWVNKIAVILRPLYEELKLYVLDSDYLHVDETTMRVIKTGTAKNTYKGYHWAYMSHDKGAIFFDYNRSRAGTVPEEVLKDYSGVIQTDGYQPYATIAKKKKQNIIHLECMAHARRKFNEALSSDAKRARYAINEIKKLYAIERRIADMDVEQKYSIRQEEAKPILDALYQWLTDNAKSLKSLDITKAINYSLGRWEALSRYIENGRYAIDNNPVENAIRPIALGRKNYLFSGSPEAAKNNALYYSFMATCKSNGIDPTKWLIDILPGMEDRKKSELNEMLPIKGLWLKNENNK